jgi:hypothetical protein
VNKIVQLLPDVLDVYFVRAVNQILQHWIDEQARFQCYRRFNRMDDKHDRPEVGAVDVVALWKDMLLVCCCVG